MPLTGTEFFAGFVSAAAPDADRFMPEFEAPSNYKKPEAIREYKEKARDAFIENAATRAVTGTVTAAHVTDAGGDTLFSLTDRTPGKVSCALVEWLCREQFEDYPWSVGGSFTPTRRLWGFDIDQFLRIVGLEAMRYGPQFGTGPYPPLRLWYKNNGAYDPYEVLTGSAERKAVGIYGLCVYLDIDTSRAELDPARNPVAHADLARIARELCVRTGLTLDE